MISVTVTGSREREFMVYGEVLQPVALAQDTAPGLQHPCLLLLLFLAMGNLHLYNFSYL